MGERLGFKSLVGSGSGPGDAMPEERRLSNGIMAVCEADAVLGIGSEEYGHTSGRGNRGGRVLLSERQGIEDEKRDSWIL